MTRKINPDVVIKEVDLNTSYIYSCNYMVGMDKISSSENLILNLHWCYVPFIEKECQ